MRYLLDTNICIDWLRGRRDISQAIENHGMQNCCISEITKAELLLGQRLAMRKGVKSDAGALDKLLDLLETVPISNAIEFFAIEKDRLCSLGQPIDDFDLLMGCSSVAAGMVLVSGNTSHMSRIQGIRLENWAD